jgi:alkylation response protein AidB-like acyl-CoA dehydrogenase
MTQKSFAEAMRSWCLYTASWQDLRDGRRARRREGRAGERGQRPAAADRQGLRLGAFVGAAGHRVAAGPFGGSGFLQDYPIEQYVRDAKIDTLYEGTTAIQGQDFFFRKIVKDQGRALGHLARRSRPSSRARAGNGRLKVERQLLATSPRGRPAIVAA